MKVEQPCCESWAIAHEPGTDNEGYGALLWEIRGRIRAGMVEQEVRFCPWCGAKKESKP
jgi:hypothetical protein